MDPKRIEVWAGIECSLNRIDDRYVDQLQRGGHYDRPDDVDRLAALGVSAVRFPVLWERVEELGDKAWSWADDCLARLRRHRITPIVGLIHHGSGPRTTAITDRSFPERFAHFAKTVAQRYPWIDRFTPINEPLTTARFATLYGHWYPHARSSQEFARAVVVQGKAISAAMRAIREVTPHALLVQTEDLGKVYSTESLAYQAAFENERRWLTFDLLCGRVRGSHPLASFLRWAGIPNRELDTLAEASCPPDIIGINHYLTSERFLDDRVDRYPAPTHGGNGRDRYADVEAVRVLRDGVAGPYHLLREAWVRYGLPIAVTEAHLACTREQQLRWLDAVWSAAVQLRDEGADIRAMTAWSAFGAHDWASLLTRRDGVYEPGLFDIRGPRPRPTALAQMVRSLARFGTYDHPLLSVAGWWQCEGRLSYPAVSTATLGTSAPRRFRSASRPLMIVGSTGTLGCAVIRACEARNIVYRAFTRSDLDIADSAAVTTVMRKQRPWAVVNCAGFVRVDDAERQRSACRRGNVDGPAALADVCATLGSRLVTFSTDLVFDGSKCAPYIETDGVGPLSEYGRTKAEAETRVLDVYPDALVVRTAAFFGDHDQYNFVTQTLQALVAGRQQVVISDVVVSPTYVPDLVDVMLDLLIDGERGVWHLTSNAAVTWEELARLAAERAGIQTSTLCPVPVDELGLPARRPRYSALDSARGTLLGSLDEALWRYARGRSWERTCGVENA